MTAEQKEYAQGYYWAQTPWSEASEIIERIGDTWYYDGDVADAAIFRILHDKPLVPHPIPLTIEQAFAALDKPTGEPTTIAWERLRDAIKRGVVR